MGLLFTPLINWAPLAAHKPRLKSSQTLPPILSRASRTVT